MTPQEIGRGDKLPLTVDLAATDGRLGGSTLTMAKAAQELTFHCLHRTTRRTFAPVGRRFSSDSWTSLELRWYRLTSSWPMRSNGSRKCLPPSVTSWRSHELGPTTFRRRTSASRSAGIAPSSTGSWLFSGG